MTHGLSFTLTAPALGVPADHRAEVCQAVAWLWSQVRRPGRVSPCTLPQWLVTPLYSGQYILLCSHGHATQPLASPVAFMAWACLDEAAELRYLQAPASALDLIDGACGDRLWITDWLTPFGHSRLLRRVARGLLAGHNLRALDHRAYARGLRVLEFRGAGLSTLQAHQWRADHPLPPGFQPRPPRNNHPQKTQAMAPDKAWGAVVIEAAAVRTADGLIPLTQYVEGSAAVSRGIPA